MRPTALKESYFPEVAALPKASALERSEAFINRMALIKNSSYAGMFSHKNPSPHVFTMLMKQRATYVPTELQNKLCGAFSCYQERCSESGGLLRHKSDDPRTLSPPKKSFDTSTSKSCDSNHTMSQPCYVASELPRNAAVDYLGPLNPCGTNYYAVSLI